MYSVARSSCSLKRIGIELLIISSAAVGVEFRHPVAFRRAILCIFSILLKFDSLMDVHTANAYSRCGRIKALRRLIQFLVFMPFVSERNIDILFNAFSAFCRYNLRVQRIKAFHRKLSPNIIWR